MDAKQFFKMDSNGGDEDESKKTQELKTIHKSDARGSTFLVSESKYKGEVLHHIPGFPNAANILASLDNFLPRQNDIWLLTFPASGTQWVYEVLGIILRNKLENLKKYKQPEMLELFDSSKLELLPSPRVINNHFREKYYPKSFFEKKKVVFVLRNPKSVAVSYYFHTINNPLIYQYTGDFSGYLPTFLDGYYDTWGNWFEHTLEFWVHFRNNPNVYFLFYEDLKLQPVEEITRLVKFLELERSVEFCEGVARLTSFNVMARGDNKTPDHFLRFRKGTISDWKNHFTVAQNEEFDKIYAEKMKNHPELMNKIKFD